MVSAVLLCSFWQSVMSVISCSLGGLIKFFHLNNQHSCSQPLCNYSNSLSASCENFLSYRLTSANQREKISHLYNIVMIEVGNRHILLVIIKLKSQTRLGIDSKPKKKSLKFSLNKAFSETTTF